MKDEVTADAERLAAIRKRREKVQGPWFRDGRDVFSERKPSSTSHDIATYVYDEGHAEFIAHAPEDIAYLLTVADERDALRARIEATTSTEGVERAAKALWYEGQVPPYPPGTQTWEEMVRDDGDRCEIWREDARRIVSAAFAGDQPEEGARREG